MSKVKETKEKEIRNEEIVTVHGGLKVSSYTKT